MRELIWTARAEADFLREFSRLEDFSEGVGGKLLDQVDSGMRLLKLMPELAPVYADNYRRPVLRDPRFGIFYIPEPRGVIVHAICDLRQEQKTILRHLDIWEDS